MDEKNYIKICSIIKSAEGEWIFYDCEDNKLPEPSEKRIFSSAMKIQYRKKRKIDRDDISTVWALVGFNDDGKETWEQVGRTKDLTNSLDEIKEDIKKIYRNEKKYGDLKNKNYRKLVFYEIDIDNYLKNDEVFVKMYGNPPENNDFALAYYFIRAAYIEGKLGFEKSARMYHKSTLDEYFYSYYEKNKNK